MSNSGFHNTSKKSMSATDESRENIPKIGN